MKAFSTLFLFVCLISILMWKYYLPEQEILYLKAEYYYCIGNYNITITVASATLSVTIEDDHIYNKFRSLLLNAVHKQGDRYYRKKEYELAIGYYGIAIQYESDDDAIDKIANAYNKWGLVYYEIKEYNKAIELFQCGINYKSTDYLVHNIALSYNNLGLIHHRLKEYDKAIVLFQCGIDYMSLDCLFNNIAMSYNNWGCVYHGEKNYKGAIVSFSHALEYKNDELYSNNLSLAYYNRGLYNYNKQLYYDALNSFNKSYNVNGYADALNMITKTEKRIYRIENPIRIEWVEVTIDNDELLKFGRGIMQWLSPMGRGVRIVKILRNILRLNKARRYFR